MGDMSVFDSHQITKLLEQLKQYADFFSVDISEKFWDIYFRSQQILPHLETTVRRLYRVLTFIRNNIDKIVDLQNYVQTNLQDIIKIDNAIRATPR